MTDQPRPSAFRLARFDAAIREGVNRWLRGQGLPPIEPYMDSAEDRQLLEESIPAQ